MQDEYEDKRDPSTWPRWCATTRVHPLGMSRQRCMQVGPHEQHVWEDC